MVAPLVPFEDFVDRVREKFGIRTRFKLKVRDEGDLITMGDRDDWEMAVQSVRKEAGKEGEEMGKMEVSYSFSVDSPIGPFVYSLDFLADGFSLSHRFGSRKLYCNTMSVSMKYCRFIFTSLFLFVIGLYNASASGRVYYFF